METVLSFVDVTYDYTGASGEKTEALSGVSFNIERGSFVTVIGHNGSGKSTLAKLANGLFRPDKGIVRMLDMDTRDESLMFDIRQKAGLVFQNPDDQLVTTIVEEDVAFGPENLGVAPKEIRERVDTALREVGMDKFALSAPHMLSGGQKQRVAIAGILAMRPEIVILDESTAMLDPKGRREVLSAAKKLNSDGMTVLWITHFMEEAVEADRLIVLDDGRIAMDGTPREVFGKADKLRELGLEPPFPAMLAEKLRKLGAYDDSVPMTNEELAEGICRSRSKI